MGNVWLKKLLFTRRTVKLGHPYYVRQASKAIAKLLLDKGKFVLNPVNSKDNRGMTKISMALRFQNRGVVELWIETGKVDINLQDYVE